MTERIVLVGMMGSGKSSVGRALAARLGWAYRDNDAALRAATGSGPDELLAERGVTGLHAAERAVLLAALADPVPAVVAAPGSAVLDPAVRERLAAEWVVWLRATPETLAARVGAGEGRPLLDGPEGVLPAVRRLAAAREPGFAAVADLVVDVDRRTPGEVVDLVVAARAEASPTCP